MVVICSVIIVVAVIVVNVAVGGTRQLEMLGVFCVTIVVETVID